MVRCRGALARACVYDKVSAIGTIANTFARSIRTVETMDWAVKAFRSVARSKVVKFSTMTALTTTPIATIATIATIEGLTATHTREARTGIR
ncbi:expressed protein [Echinococcus multilocularis]|uniref:Expressed protein n=1 Tax=Echinococcus multilocularis TaxID=6211 RepID=A0A087VXB8_ECHMU|nr:expressed protein [Echinococcus multilocularis]